MSTDGRSPADEAPAGAPGPPGRSVVHVVATRQRRGAEVFASDLIRALHGRVSQRVVVLRNVGAAGVEFAAPVEELGGPPGGLGTAAIALRLNASLRRMPGAVVCAHGGEALRAAVMAGAPRIVYRRIGLAPPAITHGPRRRWHRMLMGRASVILAVAEFLRAETVAVFGLPYDRVVTVANAVDPERVGRGADRAACRERLGVDVDARVVVSVGSLSWEKDPLRALRITGPLLARDARVVHLFVGDGPLEAELRAAAAAQCLTGVRILPARPDVGVVLAAADVLVFPSRPDGMEGMPAVLIEAGLAGVPVVADRIAGVDEVVVDGETGVLIRAGDDDAAASAIGRLLHDDDERQRLGAAAAERCRRLFTIDSVVGAYLAAFERAARGGPGR